MYSEVRRWGRPRKYTDAKFSWFQCLLWVTSGEQKIPGTTMAWATALKKNVTHLSILEPLVRRRA
ncbi:MAG: hypothetical protein WBW27_09700, partial [Pseudolabrys sp.]